MLYTKRFCAHPVTNTSQCSCSVSYGTLLIYRFKMGHYQYIARLSISPQQNSDQSNCIRNLSVNTLTKKQARKIILWQSTRRRKGSQQCPTNTHTQRYAYKTYTCKRSSFTFEHGCYLIISSVGIATRYGLDGAGIESRWGRHFPHLSRPALGPTQPPVQWVPGLSRG